LEYCSKISTSNQPPGTRKEAENVDATKESAHRSYGFRQGSSVIAVGGRIYKTVAVSGLTLLLGLGIGTFGLSEFKAPKIVFKTVPGPTVRLDVPGPAVVPQSCRDALNAADTAELADANEIGQILTTAGAAVKVLNDAGNAARAGDWAGVAAVFNAGRSLPRLPSTLSDFATYDKAASLCRGS
jgi:hypothetical protein